MPDTRELCRLGDVVFTMSDGVTGFDEESGFEYAQHDLATGKPTLQAIGETLSTVSISISIRSFLNQEVPTIIANLDKMRASGTPQKLVFASGLYQGEYVVKTISSKVLRTDRTGAVASADLTLNLLEYVSREVVTYKKTEQKPKATAVKRTVKTEPTPPPAKQEYVKIGYIDYPV